MVIVRAGTEKQGPAYVGALLMLSGQEYGRTSFSELHDRICAALRGERPRLLGEFLSGTGSARLMFEDGSMQDVRAPEEDKP